MPEEPLSAHSLAEAYLYLMATPCASCGKGPLNGADARAVGDAGRGMTVAIPVTCRSCQTVTTMTFRLPEKPDTTGEHETAIVNPTDEPSSLLDVGQWIVLFRVITEAADKETDKVQARHLGLEAAQCLEEALKFYDEIDNDLPPPEAFFTDASRERFRERPEQFSRRRLIELRSRLPSLSVMRSRLSVPKKKPWWRRFLRGVSLLVALSSPAFADSTPAGAVAPSELQARVTRLREHVTELAGADDLLDTLHFGWFDRPYARATLAILVKATSTLEREVHLRELGNGAIPDTTVRTMLAWSEGAPDRVVALGPSDGFRPHRLRVTVADLSANAAIPPLYGFVDRTTATRYSGRFGDLDLMVAMGFRVYPKHSGDVIQSGMNDLLFERADALGVAVVAVAGLRDISRRDGSPTPVPPTMVRALTVQPFTLRAMLQSTRSPPGDIGRTPALVDPVLGEPIGSSLARRALARGVWQSRRYIVDGWNTPVISGSADERSAATTAVMWVHALEGQSLGLLHGWRDLRDGSGSPYPSVLVDPAHIETIAHTALDLVRLGSYTGQFDAMPALAVAVGPDAVDAHDDNAWARWIEPIWGALLQRQIRFDVVRLASPDKSSHRHYRVLFPLQRSEVGDRTSVIVGIERALAMENEHIHRVTAREHDGALAADVFVRYARTTDGKPCVAIVNLSNRSRRLRLRSRPALGTAWDLVANTRIEAPGELVQLDPWQVRLLWPVGSQLCNTSRCVYTPDIVGIRDQREP
ncbi:MAG: hypothetical protein WBE26_18745 [Phycisphaerae bacterium]